MKGITPMQISFGKKVPIETWTIYDKKTKKFVPATAYHIDAKDESDVAYFDFMEGDWTFRTFIKYTLQSDYERYLRGISSPFDTITRLRDNDYYSIEAQNGDVACICQTSTLGNETDIAFLESNREKRYKYAGQAMLATIARQVADNNKTMTVKTPIDSARSFYRDTCKFKAGKSAGYVLPKNETDAFIKRTKKRISDDTINKSKGLWSFFRKKS